jgi:hypothetical protein
VLWYRSMVVAALAQLVKPLTNNNARFKGSNPGGVGTW